MDSFQADQTDLLGLAELSSNTKWKKGLGKIMFTLSIAEKTPTTLYGGQFVYQKQVVL